MFNLSVLRPSRSPSSALLFIASLCLAGLMAFAATSYALGQETGPRVRPNLPIAQLPATALPEATATAINNLIGAELLARTGITADSYATVRRLADTGAGPLYFIPGSNGGCVVLADKAASCGDPGRSGQPLLSLAFRDSERRWFVGGGIAAEHVRSLTAELGDGRTVLLTPAAGVFVLTEAHKLDSLKEIRPND